MDDRPDKQRNAVSLFETVQRLRRLDDHAVRPPEKGIKAGDSVEEVVRIPTGRISGDVVRPLLSL